MRPKTLAAKMSAQKTTTTQSHPAEILTVPDPADAPSARRNH
jgi:hypothetical protein